MRVITPGFICCGRRLWSPLTKLAVAAVVATGGLIVFPLKLPATDRAPLRFMVTGDSRGGWIGEPVNASILSELAAEALRIKPAFVLFTGDLVYWGNQEAFQIWRDLWAEVYTAGIGIYPVSGNHDAADPAGFEAVFGSDLPDNGPPGEVGRTYFFGRDNVLVLGLDHYAAPGKVNQSWVNAVLATNTRPHVFAMGHEPAFKVVHYDTLDDYPEKRNALWNSFRTGGCRAYFSGHDHFFDHMRLDDGDGNQQNDVHQLIVGAAGAPLYGDGLYDGDNGSWTPTRVYHDNNYGYVLVEIDGLNATLTWYTRTEAGTYEASDSWSYTAQPRIVLHVERVAPDSPRLRLSFAGEEEVWYVTEASNDLRDWDPIGLNQALGGRVAIEFDPSRMEPRLFFRVRQY